MLYWALVEQALHEHMSDEYENRYIIMVSSSPSLVKVRDTTVGSQRTDQGWGVKRTNTDLSNAYRRSTTEAIVHPIGQNILLIYPHFGIDFLQPPRFLNSEDSETIKLDNFLSFQIVNMSPTGKVFHRYPVGIHTATVTCCISCLLVDSKYIGKLRSLMIM